MENQKTIIKQFSGISDESSLYEEMTELMFKLREYGEKEGYQEFYLNFRTNKKTLDSLINEEVGFSKIEPWYSPRTDEEEEPLIFTRHYLDDSFQDWQFEVYLEVPQSEKIND